METDNVVLWEKEDLNWKHWHPLEPEITGLDCRIWIRSGDGRKTTNSLPTIRYEVVKNKFMIMTVEDDPQMIEPVENDE